MGVLAFLIAVALAFANGANDNGKGVATLIGGGVMKLWPGVIYAAVTTMAGSITAIWIGAELIRKFKGKGVVGDTLLADPAFALGMAVGAAFTVLLATWASLPISTTHAMVGAIIGIGMAADDLIVESVWGGFFMPLLASPLLAMVSAAMLYLLFRGGKRLLRLRDQNGDANWWLDGGHILSAGALSFARGLNDTPKIAAVLLAATAADASLGWDRAGAVSATGVAMLIGGLLAVQRVAKTVSFEITDMDHGQSFSANVNAAILVIFASRLGLPVSTTHVTCGSLFGIGAVNRTAHVGMIARILAAWVGTLPIAGIAGALTWLAFR